MEIRSIRKVRFCPHLYVQKHTRLKSQNKNVSKNMECGYGYFLQQRKNVNVARMQKRQKWMKLYTVHFSL